MKSEQLSACRRSISSEETGSEEAFSDTPNFDRQNEHGDSCHPRRLREQTKAACLRCKKRKGKCSGERPFCSYCRRRNLNCQYDVRIGSSRRAELEDKLNQATSRSAELGVIIHALQSGSDEESTMLLARLRMGEALSGVVNSLLMPQGVNSLPATHVKHERNLEHSVVQTSDKHLRASESPRSRMAPDVDLSFLVQTRRRLQPIDRWSSPSFDTNSSSLQPLSSRNYWTPLPDAMASDGYKLESNQSPTHAHCSKLNYSTSLFDPRYVIPPRNQKMAYPVSYSGHRGSLPVDLYNGLC